MQLKEGLSKERGHYHHRILSDNKDQPSDRKDILIVLADIANKYDRNIE